MNDAGESSEVKKRKGPSASYQKARREAIKAGTWNPRFRRTNAPGVGEGMGDDRSSILDTNTQGA